MAERIQPKRLAIALTYYAPYVSGLTNLAKIVAEGMVRRGWDITVVASQHEPALPLHEVLEGVRVVRTPVVMRLGKAVVSPRLPLVAAREIRRAGAGNIHLPMPEAGPTTLLLGRQPNLVATYHCDVTLPATPVNRAITRAVDSSSKAAVRRSEVVAVTSLDYLESSRLARQIAPKAAPIPVPSLTRRTAPPGYRDGTGPHIGFLGRIVEEKGIPYLIRAFRQVAQADWVLLVGGDFERVAGGSVIDEVRSAASDDPRIRLLGFIPDDRVAEFYASLDVFAFPSVNPLEAFGIAQVEAMLAGVPVVASDLPGVRQPVTRTGFGRIVPPRDVAQLGRALDELVRAPSQTWVEPRAEAERMFSLEALLDQWEEVFDRISRTRPLH